MDVLESDLQELTIVMFGRKYVLHPAEDLEIHPSTVGDHLQEQASRFAFYATVRDMAQAKMEALEAEAQQVESTLAGQYRDGTLDLPKITDDTVKHAVRSNPQYTDAKESVITATMEFNRLNSIVKAFEHRRETLIAMSARANNTTWNDKDIRVEVSATISPLTAQKTATQGLGKHPSKR